MSSNSHSVLQEFEKELSTKLGRQLVIHKIANRMVVYEGAGQVGEITEQELLASDCSPVDIFLSLLDVD